MLSTPEHIGFHSLGEHVNIIKHSFSLCFQKCFLNKLYEIQTRGVHSDAVFNKGASANAGECKHLVSFLVGAPIFMGREISTQHSLGRCHLWSLTGYLLYPWNTGQICSPFALQSERNERNF